MMTKEVKLTVRDCQPSIPECEPSLQASRFQMLALSVPHQRRQAPRGSFYGLVFQGG